VRSSGMKLRLSGALVLGAVVVAEEVDGPVGAGKSHRLLQDAGGRRVKGGLAGSTVLNAKAPMVISRNFQPGFRIALHQKDLRNALLAAESMKVSLPLTSVVQNMLMALMNNGKGSLDHSAIVTIVETMAGVEIKKAATAKA